MPKKLAVGVKVTVVPASATVPLVALDTPVSERDGPSTSVTVATSEAAGNVAAVSSAMVPAPLATMTGASLTGVTVTVTWAVAVSEPSLIV